MTKYYGSSVSIGSGVSARLVARVSHTPTTITTDTASVTVTWDINIQTLDGTGFGSGDTLTVSGDASFSGTTPWETTSAGGEDSLADGSETVSLIYGETQIFDLDATLADVAGTLNDASISVDYTVPERPVEAPAAVTGFTVTRVSDTRQDLAWTNNPTTAAPYDDILVRRRVGGSGSYSTIATLAGSATSYADTSTVADRLYDYAIQPRNDAGVTTTYAASSHSTTPATPDAPTATKQDSGDIVVSRSELSGSAATWNVRAAGGATLASDLTGTSWTHVAPSASQAWSYEIQNVSSSPVLSSGWSAASNTIQLVAPPDAPTSLAPSVADATEAIALTWQHNPVDDTPQRQYEVETRATSGDAWVSLGVVTSATSSHTVAANTWTNPGSRQWRVRTWGQHADPGAYSSTGIVDLSARPVAGITVPTTTHDSPELTVEWTYHDAEASAQSAWRVTLSSGGNAMEVASAVSTATTRTLGTELADGSTYTVAVEVQDGAGLWSDAATQTFTVTYAPPPDPALVAGWRTDDGYTVLTPTVGAPAAGEEAVDHLRVERAAADGWVVVADNLTSGAAVVDRIPPLGTVVPYRAVAVSVTGSVAYSVVANVDTTTCWLFVNHGPDFGQIARFDSNLTVDREFSQGKVLRWYAGRSAPVVRVGVQRSHTYTFSADFFSVEAAQGDQSSWDDLLAAAAADVVCVRDPLGTRIFATITSASQSGWLDWQGRTSVPLTVVDWSEP